MRRRRVSGLKVAPKRHSRRWRTIESIVRRSATVRGSRGSCLMALKPARLQCHDADWRGRRDRGDGLGLRDLSRSATVCRRRDYALYRCGTMVTGAGARPADREGSVSTRQNGCHACRNCLRPRSRSSPSDRKQHFIGRMLRHHHHRSTEFMSRWIEAKNR